MNLQNNLNEIYSFIMNNHTESECIYALKLIDDLLDEVEHLKKMETIKQIKNWYNTKETFTIKEIEYINRLKDTCEIDALDISDIIITYIYDKLESLPIKYDNEIICVWDKNNLSNSLTSNENYLNLLNYLNNLNLLNYLNN